MAARPIKLDIYRTAIPMRRFEHAAAGRDLAEAVVVRLECSDGQVGWGETLPRPYVTGETLETVVRDIAQVIWPGLSSRPLRREELEQAIPVRAPDGRCIHAAACAVELAALRWALAPAEIAAPISARVSGVLGWREPAQTAWRLRLMRWLGLRDFKLKLGLGEETDAENLRLVRRKIGRAVAAGRLSLRVDVNGGWSAAETPERTAELKALGVCCVEQPVFCTAGELADLAERCRLPLMADESLLTDADAQTLLRTPSRVWWNLRLSKNGGLLRTLKLCELARRHGVPFTLGCMVGESSILSAAQRWLLSMGASPRFVEGNYGRFLLAGDVTKRSLRFGRGGRLDPVGFSAAEAAPARLTKWGRPQASLSAP